MLAENRKSIIDDSCSGPLLVVEPRYSLLANSFKGGSVMLYDAGRVMIQKDCYGCILINGVNVYDLVVGQSTAGRTWQFLLTRMIIDESCSSSCMSRR